LQPHHHQQATNLFEQTPVRAIPCRRRSPCPYLCPPYGRERECAALPEDGICMQCCLNSVYFSLLQCLKFLHHTTLVDCCLLDNMESFLEIEQFGESHSTINRLLGALSYKKSKCICQPCRRVQEQNTGCDMGHMNMRKTLTVHP